MVSDGSRDDDDGEERQFPSNPFFTGDKIPRIPVEVANQKSSSGLYQNVRAATEEHWTRLHAILFQATHQQTT
jgi:hypothetical protein